MKITKGKVKVSKSGNPQFDLCVISEDGGSICFITNWSDKQEVAEFIEEAFNVANETGMTPRQLSDDRAYLSDNMDYWKRCSNESDDRIIELELENKDLREALTGMINNTTQNFAEINGFGDQRTQAKKALKS